MRSYRQASNFTLTTGLQSVLLTSPNLDFAGGIVLRGVCEIHHATLRPQELVITIQRRDVGIVSDAVRIYVCTGEVAFNLRLVNKSPAQ